MFRRRRRAVLARPSTNFDGKRTFKDFNPRASVSFKPTEGSQLLYAAYSQGFKGGGFDPRGVGVNAPDTERQRHAAAMTRSPSFLSFRPEKVEQL